MTFSNYKRMFFENPMGKIGEIALELLRFAFTFRKSIACALCLLAVAVLVLRVWKQDKALLKRVVLFSVCFYGVYMFFLLAMYVFSMGTVESEGLPSAARYTNTALFVINYVLCALCVRMLSQAELGEKRQRVCAAVLLLLIPCRMLLCGESPIFLRWTKWEDPVRREMNALIAENQVPGNSRYCLLVPEDDDGLYNFKLRYTLLSGEIRQIRNAGKEDLETIEEPYVFVCDPENPDVQNWLAEGTGEGTVILMPQTTK